MDTTKLEKLFKVKLDDRKGEGEIVLAKPLAFPLGNILISTSYISCDSFDHIIFDVDKEKEFGYEDSIEFYDQDTFLTEMFWGSMFIMDKTKDEIEEINRFAKSRGDDNWRNHSNHDELRKIIRAKNLNIRVRSRVRKYPDVRWEGADVLKFQQTIEMWLNLINDPKRLSQFIAKHDNTFEEDKFRQSAIEEKERKKEKAQKKLKEEAEQKKFQRQVQKNHLIGLIFMTIFLGVIILAVSAFVLFIVACVKGGNEPDYGIMWWSIVIAVGAALVYFFKQLGNM